MRTKGKDKEKLEKADAIVQAYKRLYKLKLNRGASGNISVKTKNGFLITPSGVTTERLNKEYLVELDNLGTPIVGSNPSSEWCLHAEIYKSKREVGAVVHTHSNFACALSSLHEDLPPFSYMVAVAGGKDVRCCDYAIFGSRELANKVVEALKGRKACLMANHGLVCCGEDLTEAMYLAVELEALCEQYMIARSIGEVKVLSDTEMKMVLEKFENYGHIKRKSKVK